MLFAFSEHSLFQTLQLENLLIDGIVGNSKRYCPFQGSRSLKGRHIDCMPADYLTKVAVRNKASKDIKVEEIMTERSKLMTIDPNHTTVDAMTLMIKHNFRHVPVVRPSCPKLTIVWQGRFYWTLLYIVWWWIRALILLHMENLKPLFTQISSQTQGQDSLFMSRSTKSPSIREPNEERFAYGAGGQRQLHGNGVDAWCGKHEIKLPVRICLDKPSFAQAV